MRTIYSKNILEIIRSIHRVWRITIIFRITMLPSSSFRLWFLILISVISFSREGINSFFTCYPFMFSVTFSFSFTIIFIFIFYTFVRTLISIVLAIIMINITTTSWIPSNRFSRRNWRLLFLSF